MPKTNTMQSPSFKMEALSGNNWSITNDSDTDIVVISIEDEQTDNQLYERSLMLLQTTDGNKAIGKGTVANIPLYAAGYNIIIARADNLFPVKIIDVTQDTETLNYPSASVTASDAADMKLAEKFKKTITAFPTSALAKIYQDALSSRDVQKVAAFFTSAKDFQSLTINMVVAVDTYYKVYPFGWADYADEKTYSLYTSDGTDNTYMGSITLHNARIAPLSPNKTVPDFTITYTKETASQQLYYSNGQFTDDPDSESPAICLQGLFIMKAQITQADTDNVFISVLRGTIDHKSVMGSEEEQDEDGSSSFFDRILNPQSTVDCLKLFGIVLGGVFVLGILCKLAKMSYDAYKKFKGEPAQREYDRINREWREEQARLMKTDQRYLDRLEQIKQARLPENFPEHYRILENQAVKFSYQQDMSHVTDIWETQRIYMERIVKYGRNPRMEQVSDSLSKIEDWLNLNPEPTALAKNLDSFMQEFGTNSTVLNNEWVKIKNKSSADMIEMDKASKAIEDVSPDQEIAGFTITYKKAAKSSQPIPLYFVHGKFVDDKNSDYPAVSLQGMGKR